MPSILHETLGEMFRLRPSLAAEVLVDVLGVALPEHEQARVEAGDLTDIAPTEYRADAVVVLTSGDAPVVGVIIEVQLRRDPDKRWSWPVYLDQIPVITDPARATAHPELAVLSAMAHGARPERYPVLDALLSALENIDPDRALLYSDLVLDALPMAAQRYLEALMSTGTHVWRSDFARRHRATGHAEAGARAVLAVLDARRIDVSDDARTRITECTDLDQLDAWVRRAATATSAEDVFA